MFNYTFAFIPGNIFLKKQQLRMLNKIVFYEY